jgi:hypothetical protein
VVLPSITLPLVPCRRGRGKLLVPSPLAGEDQGERYVN